MGGRSFIGDTVNVTFSACVPERWSCRFRVRMDFRGFLSQTWRCMLDQRRERIAIWHAICCRPSIASMDTVKDPRNSSGRTASHFQWWPLVGDTTIELASTLAARTYGVGRHQGSFAVNVVNWLS